MEEEKILNICNCQSVNDKKVEKQIIMEEEKNREEKSSMKETIDSTCTLNTEQKEDKSYPEKFNALLSEIPLD